MRCYIVVYVYGLFLSGNEERAETLSFNYEEVVIRSHIKEESTENKRDVPNAFSVSSTNCQVFEDAANPHFVENISEMMQIKQAINDDKLKAVVKVFKKLL